MGKILAEIISFLFHPLLMTSWLIVALTFISPSILGVEILAEQGKLMLSGVFFVLTFILPMASIIILRVTSNISSIQLENRSERGMPFIFTTIYYGISSYFFMNQYFISYVIGSIMISVFITVLIITVITFYWKISAHSASTWGISGILIALNIISANWALIYILIVSILTAGFVCSARLLLNVHSFKQIVWGGIVGLVTCFSTILIMN